MPPEPSRSDINEMLNGPLKRMVPDGARSSLNRLFKEMDQLLFLDTTGELAVDRATLIRIATNEEFMPASLRHITLVETSKHLGRRIKEVGRGRRITWHDGANYGLPSRSMSVTELESWGVTERTSSDQLAAIVKERIPDLPRFWINDNTRELTEAIVQQFQLNRTVWDCAVANLGWWAALTMIGGLAILAILLGSGVPWPVALLIAGIYQTGATLYFILQCAANPNFQQR